VHPPWWQMSLRTAWCRRLCSYRARRGSHLGGGEAALASALTIGGFVLTQMVLNQQRRRDMALHLKLDELVVAMKGARNEVAGVEGAAVEEIERLKSAQKD
jgi:hypothetical protein